MAEHAGRSGADRSVSRRERRPAFYAVSPGSAWRDWWTVLHPPYTAWHLAYVVIGAALAPSPKVSILLATLTAFFLAVGIAAHTLDELHGRPLRTTISSRVLVGSAVIGLAGAAALGGIGVARQGPVLLPFIFVGAFLVVAYNLEWFGGAVHNDILFALAWGSFPVLTAYVAETKTIRPAALLAAAAAFALSYAQRALSTRARLIRRSTDGVEGVLSTSDGARHVIDESFLLGPIERALRALSWGVVALAAALAVDKMG
ncbi:MAG: hypothetical protein ACYDGN_00105 [Acidimicrobiales bacterium]